MVRLLPLALVSGGLLLSSTHALADSANVAAAETLFKEGQRLMTARDYEHACPKLAESQRLDPGTGTLLNLATCYEEGGKKATAWLTWLEAARSARVANQTDREELARESAARLESQLGRLTISVSPDAPSDLTVKRGNEELARATWGSALPLDAGKYVIEASSPGHETFQKEVTVVDGENVTIHVPQLTLATSAPAPAPVPAPSQQDEGSSDGSAQRTWGYVLGGVGVVGVGVGAVLGVLAIGKNNDSKEFCTGVDDKICTQPGVDLRNEAFGMATGSTIAVGVGAAVAATGVILILTAPSSSTQVAAVPSWDGGSVVVRGSF